MRATEVEYLHGVTDGDKYAALVESMTRNGWVGAPIVIVDRSDYCMIPLAITGSHRLAAAESIDYDPPMIDLVDLFAATGLDYDATLAAYLDCGFDLYDAIIRAAAALPVHIIDYYGLDAH